MTEIVLAPQNFRKRGWILVRDDKFWGEIYPEDRSHGGGSAMYGWTNDIRKAQIAKHEKKPPHKGWFTYAGNTSEIRRMSEGEWVQVEILTTLTLTTV